MKSIPMTWNTSKRTLASTQAVRSCARRVPQALFACAALGLATFGVGCTGGDVGTTPEPAGPIVSVFELVNPTGTVTGQVVNALTGEPLEAVAVTLVATGETASTDAIGTFRFEEVPASAAVALRYTIDGYGAALDTVTIPSSAGTIAQNNGVAFSGPIGLLPTAAGETGSRPRLNVREGAAATVTATVSARLNVGFFVSGAPQGQLIGTAAAEAEDFVIDGFPDLRELAVAVPTARVLISITPADVTAYRPQVLDLAVGEVLARGTLVVDLDPVVPVVVEVPTFEEGDAVSITNSNVVDLFDDTSVLPSVLASNAAVSLTFNRPIRPETFYAGASDASGNNIETQVTAGLNNAFSIAFVGALVDGGEVNLVVEALADAPVDEQIAPFFAEGTFFVVNPSPVSIISARFAPTGNPDAIFCPNNVNQTVLVLELSAPIGARFLDNGTAVAATANETAAISIRSSGGFELLPLLTDEVPARAQIRELPSQRRNSGFGTQLIVPGNLFRNAPTVNGQNLPIASDFLIRFNDLSEAEELNSGNTLVVREPNGAPLNEIAVSASVAMDGC